MASTNRTRAIVGCAVLALTLLAFVERWIGLGIELPQREDPDAAIVHVAAAHDLPEGEGPNDSAYSSTIYPLLFADILVALPGSNYPVARAPDAPIAEHWAAASEPSLRGRRLIALLSLLVVPCTFLLARRFSGDGWALLAAAFAATSLLALHMSQQARPHGGLMGLSALALVACLALLKPASLWAYVTSGATAALALAALHSGLFVLPALALAHFLGWRADKDRRRWLWLCVPIALCMIAFVIAYPFLVFGDPLQSKESGTLNFGQHAIRWDTWNGRGFLAMLPAVFAFDPVLVVLSLAGFVGFIVALARGMFGAVSRCMRNAALVLGAHALVTIVAFGMQQQIYARFFLPVLPIACIFAVFGVGAFARMCAKLANSMSARHGLVPALVVAIAVVSVAVPAWASSWYACIRARPDTATLAARWIEEHVAPDAGKIAIDFTLSLPILQQRAGLAEFRRWSLKPWQRYQLDVMKSEIVGPHWDVHPILFGKMAADHKIDRDEVIARITQLNARWAVVVVPTAFDAQSDETRVALRRLAGDPVARIFPFDPERDPAPTLDRDSDLAFVWKILHYSAWGQPIEIYRLP